MIQSLWRWWRNQRFPFLQKKKKCEGEGHGHMCSMMAMQMEGGLGYDDLNELMKVFKRGLLIQIFFIWIQYFLSYISLFYAKNQSYGY
jgi:hypothetical protein